MTVKINTEYIKLDQLLKWAGIVSLGSEAKLLISDGRVKLNGLCEMRRGKKIRKNDIIEVQLDKITSFRVE